MKNFDADIIPYINNSFEISLPEKASLEELKEKLSTQINYLINHDFEKLVSILYRIDVNESKMRKLLESNKGENAAGLIADLVIERQLQKAESRKRSASDKNIPDEEKW
ncbi:MAG TPA: hypothetical protein PKC72_01175 [Chitinophagaceae bacterium]|nr:hypothetical protein [Chitinophagaceae bacterium]